MSTPCSGGRDLATGLACLTTSVVLFGLTLDLPGPSLLVPIGPGFYPRIILGITAALSAALLAQSVYGWRRKAHQGGEHAPASPNYSLVVATFATFGVYVALLPYLGYRISTFVFVAALQAVLDPPRGWKGWGLLATVALVTSVATYYTFERYLSVLLPRGRWTDF